MPDNTPPERPNGDGYPYTFNQRMDRMNDFLQSMTESFLEHHRVTMEEISATREAYREQHAHFLEEVRELLNLQKEHRIDIMALFQHRHNINDRLDALEGKKKPDEERD